MQKIVFPKQSKTFDMVDLGIDGADGVLFKFWVNPSKPVMKALYDVIMRDQAAFMALEDHELEEMEQQYYEALTQVIVETNVDSLRFDTVDDVKKSFEAEDVPIGFVHKVVVGYVHQMLEENDSVKKALALYHLASNSGKDGAKNSK